jgi:hypothetical protein
LFPQSSSKFYSWLHKGRVPLPNTNGFRLAGVLWILLVLVVSF